MKSTANLATHSTVFSKAAAVRRMSAAGKKAKSRGIGLLEFTLALVLGLVVLFGVISLYKSSSQSSQIASEASALQSLTVGVKALFPGAATYTGLSAEMLIKANKVPTNMIDGTGLKHAWGSAVTVAADATGGYNITYAAVPSSACIELVSAVGANYNRSTVGSTVVKSASQTAVDVAQATTACTATATVGIIFNSL